jgi:hypothetical protein
MKIRTSSSEPRLNLRAGELVEVRSRSEILATLDARAAKDALPFMPEMLQYCGQRFTVYKRAHKTCDTIRKPVGLRMDRAVHLTGVRCDGGAHGGCQAGCLLFWKEAWLKRVPDREQPREPLGPEPTGPTGPGCTEADVFEATRRKTNGTPTDAEIFVCQATELPRATSSLAWWDVRQYFEDITSGNIGVAELGFGLATATFNLAVRTIRRCVEAMRHLVSRRPIVYAEVPGVGIGQGVSIGEPAESPRSVATYARAAVNNLLVEYPYIRGKLHKTPSIPLNLEPGELVQIRSKAEILQTLDVNSRNRGLAFDVEMVPYCGGTYRVLRRVEKIVNEKTGEMLRLPSNCIVLDGVVCKGCLSRHRLFCPRSIYSYWHEVWLNRVR